MRDEGCECADGANAQNSGHLEKKPKRTLEELMGGNLGNGLSSKTQKTDLTTGVDVL